MNFKDITGQQFERLTVVKRVENDKHGFARWLCRCVCGKEIIACTAALRSGKNKSCGCYNQDRITKHNLSKTRIYKSWQRIKSRCINKSFKNYAGRGISVCDEWKNDFISFHTWSMRNGYKDNLTIDRIDVNGNYEPSNCRWVTMKDQENNRRNNKFVTYNGETKTVSQWADQYSIHRCILNNRLKKGWSFEDAVNIKVIPRPHKGRKSFIDE